MWKILCPLPLVVLGCCYLLVAVVSTATAETRSPHVCVHDKLEKRYTPQFARQTYSTADGVAMRSRASIRSACSYAPIRIVLDWTTFNGDVTDATKAAYFQNTLMPRAQAYFNSALSVCPVSGPLYYGTKCASFWQTTGTPCASIVTSSTAVCGFTNIPLSYYKDVTYYSPNYNSPAQTSTGGTGYPTAGDVVVFISARDTSCSSSTLAYASACLQDSTTNRPIFGQINMCATNFVGNSPQTTEYGIQSDTAVIIHELTHLLGFSSDLYTTWINTATSNAWSAVTAVDTERGTTITKIITTHVALAVQAQFGCPSLNGAEIENGGGSGTSGSHWEMRIYNGEYMNGMVSSFTISFSNITLSMFADTGYYLVNYAAANNLLYGYLAGCSFATSYCLSGGGTAPTPVSSTYFCNGAVAQSCNFERG